MFKLFTMTNGAMHVPCFKTEQMVDIKIGKWLLTLCALETGSEKRKQRMNEVSNIRHELYQSNIIKYLDVASLSEVSIRFLI